MQILQIYTKRHGSSVLPVLCGVTTHLQVPDIAECHCLQTTPLHYDPYINVFRLAGSSGPDAAKHFLIFPPSMSSHLKRGGDASSLRNTSPVQFDVHNAESDSPAVHFKPDSPSQGSFEQLADAAYAVTLRAGELLMIPERWWHRVENIGPSNGWTAGVGYWFLMRK